LETLNLRIGTLKTTIAEYQAQQQAGEGANTITTTDYLYDQQGRLIAEITAGQH